LKINVIILYILFCTALSCSTIEQSDKTSHVQDHKNIVWPSAPQKPRILFVQSISGFDDIGPKKSWIQKTLNSLLGSEEPEVTMLRPYDVAATSNKLYVTDPSLSAVHIFDLVKKNYSRITEAGKIELSSPQCVATDANGELYITDSVLKRVFIYNDKGVLLKELGSNTVFDRPTGIAVHGDRVYVVDTQKHLVSVFSRQEGTLLFQFGKKGAGNGDFNYPTHIFIGRNNKIYITDSLNFRIQLFDLEGKFLSSFGRLGDARGNLAKPKGVAVDSEGHIYVADSEFDNVQIFNNTGQLLLVFGETGRGHGKMFLPAGVFIDSQDRIYVADSYNKRIQIFQYLKE
jgi:DNA-binding beta-propeller fold protein YncE